MSTKIEKKRRGKRRRGKKKKDYNIHNPKQAKTTCTSFLFTDDILLSWINFCTRANNTRSNNNPYIATFPMMMTGRGTPILFSCLLTYFVPKVALLLLCLLRVVCSLHVFFCFSREKREKDVFLGGRTRPKTHVIQLNTCKSLS